MEPEVDIAVHLEGRAQAKTQIEQYKTVDALTYPDFFFKGIAAVGPTLDLYGQKNYILFCF